MWGWEEMLNLWTTEAAYFFLHPWQIWVQSTIAAAASVWTSWWPTNTTLVLLFLAAWHLSRNRNYLLSSAAASSSVSSVSSPSLHIPLRAEQIIPDSDLRSLIDCLDDKPIPNQKWEHVVHKSKINLSYTAKCCKSKNGALKYMSVTTFENCPTELLRDFYMDNDYRKAWDKLIVSHEQLQVDETNGVEIGRTIKKFPLLTPREYVLAWKLWEGKDKSFYCFIKECEHHLAPLQKRYVRVGFFRSGWRIEKVPGKNASEIKMVHEEDSSLNVEMTKLAFAKGIWSYVCKMETALHGYAAFRLSRKTVGLTAVSLIQKVPPGYESVDGMSVTGTVRREAFAASMLNGELPGESSEKKFLRRPSKKLVANGLLLIGGVVCLARAHSSFSAKVALTYIWRKLCKHGHQTS